VLLLHALTATTSPSSPLVRGVWAEGKRAGPGRGPGSRAGASNSPRAASTSTARASTARAADVEVVAAGSIRVEDFVAGAGPRAEDARLGDEFVRWLDTHDDVEMARRLAVVAHEQEALQLRQQAERIRAVEDFLVELLPICNIFHLVTSTFGLVSATPRRASAHTAIAPSTHAHHARSDRQKDAAGHFDENLCICVCSRVRACACVCVGVWPTGDNINDEARGQAKLAGIPRGDNIHTSFPWNRKRTLQRRRWASKRLFTHTHVSLPQVRV
jgi:hypothetical protein